jgi:hypothetical protein
VWLAISPAAYMKKFAEHRKRVLIVYAKYDLTFLRQFSEEVVQFFRDYDINFKAVALPCGHYTVGEIPFKFIDGWHLGSFIYSAFKHSC